MEASFAALITSRLSNVITAPGEHQRRRLREHGARLHRALTRAADDASLAILDTSGVVVCWFGRAGDSERVCSPILHRHVGQFYLRADVAGKLPQRHLQAASSQGESSRDGWRVSAAGHAFWGVTLIRPIITPGGDMEGYVHLIRPSCDSREGLRVAAAPRLSGAIAQPAPDYREMCAAA